MKSFYLLVLSLLVAGLHADSDAEVEYVSWGSSVKLQHVSTGVRLHSHDLKYGGGSGQQSVTGVAHAHDPNSLWVVKPGHGEHLGQQGKKIPCGSVIRLEHLNTGCNLHTHKIPAGLSNKWEVSAFGYRDEIGDLGDNFELLCDGKKAGEWLRRDKILLKHVDTKLYVSASSKFKYGHPVEGQLEIFSTDTASPLCHWKTNEGFYFSHH